MKIQVDRDQNAAGGRCNTPDLPSRLLNPLATIGRNARSDLLRDPTARAPTPENKHPHLPQLHPVDLQRSHDRRQRHAPSPLDVVVETREAATIPVENVPRIRHAKVLEVHHRAGEVFAGGPDEPVDEVVVRGAPDAFPLEPEVQVVVAQGLAVCAHVQHDGEDAGGINAGARRHEDQLRHADEDPADALVADAQDLLAVADHDVIHPPSALRALHRVGVPAEAAHPLLDLVWVADRQETAPFPPE